MQDQDNKYPLWRLLLTELLGTFVLIFIDAGGAVIAALSGDVEVSSTARALASGMTVMAMIFSFGHVSGAHINPAISLAFYLRGVFPLQRLPMYVTAQLGGAIAAAAVLALLFGDSMDAAVNRPKLETANGFWMEVMLTGFLALVILSTAQVMKITGPNAAIPVGATVALCTLVGRPVSDAVLNPARALGPAIVTGELNDVWIYITAPFIGAVFAVIFAWAIHGHPNGAEHEAAQGQKSPE